jgi:uncharacterized protein YgbK (DUF1537 family)
MSHSSLPEGLLVAWYGDDFTGSAAVMEVLSFAGLDSILFLDVPTPARMACFAHMRGIGIAGTARAHSPVWMEDKLPPLFAYLKSLNAPVTHYKVCSTMDSAPETGSIGKAIDLAMDQFGSTWIPMLFAAPAIRRYQCFGHLFAAAPGGVFRLDRHPVMARHPVTPMDEADVVRHTARQTDRPVALVDVEMLAGDAAPPLPSDGSIVALDTVSETDLGRVGGLIWDHRGKGVFAVGSQGVEYALVKHWGDTGRLPPMAEPEGAGRSEHLVVVSGSVSDVTARQIDWALDHGFAPAVLDIVAVLTGEDTRRKAINAVVDTALAMIEGGNDPLVYSARGPDDPAVGLFHEAVSAAGLSPEKAHNLIGETLGIILEKVLRKSGVRRAVISGGDTSGHASQCLGIYALSALAPTIPGAALFQAHSEKADFDGLQLALKGGQMGTDDYFGWIRQGGGAK